MDSFERGEPEPVRHPRKLIWEIAFRVETPLALEDCIDRIFSIDTGSKWLIKRRKLVKVYQFEDGIIYFHIHVPRHPSSGWLIGQLERGDNSLTSVYGIVGVDALPVYGILLFMGFLCLLFVAIPVGLIFALVMFGWFIYVIRKDSLETRDELTRILEEKLTS
ncbi:MAG: hypothetical protein ABI690_17385 [Chloroflexota bacterium]